MRHQRWPRLGSRRATIGCVIMNRDHKVCKGIVQETPTNKSRLKSNWVVSVDLTSSLQNRHLSEAIFSKEPLQARWESSRKEVRFWWTSSQSCKYRPYERRIQTRYHLASGISLQLPSLMQEVNWIAWIRRLLSRQIPNSRHGAGSLWLHNPVKLSRYSIVRKMLFLNGKSIFSGSFI